MPEREASREHFDLFRRFASSSPLRAAAIGLAAILISMIRRPNQINRPAIWVEEGTQFLPQYLEHGWRFLFDPVNGYLIIPSKLNAWIAYHLSFEHYPEVSYVLALLSAGIVSVAICKAPTVIPFRPIAALIPFAIPFDPEPVAIGEYVFWYYGLLSALALFWQAGRAPVTRSAFAFIGGLSAPLGISLTPLFVIRAIASRSRSDIAAAVAAGIASAVQLGFILTTGAVRANYTKELLADPIASLRMVIEKFVGDLIWNPEASLLVGVIVLIPITFWLIEDVRAQRYAAPALAICAGVSIVLAILRVPLGDINAMAGGPRYFLYPYIFLCWMGLALAGQQERRKILGFTGLVICANVFNFLYRTQDRLDWSGAVHACLASPGSHDLPVHFTGQAAIAWKVTLTQDQCRKLADVSLF